MNDDYLWDRSGEPDPEVERLEKLLGRYRHDAPLRVARFRARRWLAIAASVIVVAGGLLSTRFFWREGAPWAITRVEGTATIGAKPISERDRLAVGQQLRTDSTSRVKLQLARVGEVEVGPDSELILLTTRTRTHRVALQRGTIQAKLWAPPFTFSVRTGAGVASDVGCAFTLMYANGRGLVRVTSGWVAFEGEEGETMVPQKAVAELRDGIGAGSPYYPDAAPPFVAALRRLDFARDRAALATVLAHARTRDALTLLHLLERAKSEQERSMIFERLSELAPPPRAVKEEDIVRGDFRELDLWRINLGLTGLRRPWWMNWRDAL